MYNLSFFFFLLNLIFLASELKSTVNIILLLQTCYCPYYRFDCIIPALPIWDFADDMVDDVDGSLDADGVGADLGVVPTLKVVTHTKVNHLKERKQELLSISWFNALIELQPINTASLIPKPHWSRALDAWTRPGWLNLKLLIHSSTKSGTSRFQWVLDCSESV